MQVNDHINLQALKRTHHLPRALGSCHTAFVEGYVIEGHVPADVIERLLQERPQIAGIAVPGMPVGSPGMEIPGRPAVPFDVIAFEVSGKMRVFARR